MKKLILLLSAIIYSYLSFAQWQQCPGSSGWVSSFCQTSNKLIAGWSTLQVSTNNGSSWLFNNSVMSVHALVAFNNTVIAGTSDGAYKSTDNGTNWLYSSNGLISPKYVNDLCYDGTRMFAATNAGVFLSTDAGANWVKKSNGLLDEFVRVIAKNSSNNYFYCLNYGRPYLSTDNGENWVIRNIGIPGSTTCTDIAFLNNTVYTSTADSGIYYTTNNGDNWIKTNNGLASLKCNTVFNYNNILFAGFAMEGGVFMSNDAGANWTDVSNGLTKKSILSFFVYGNYMFAGNQYEGFINRRLVAEMIGIKEFNIDNILSLYPNPAQNQITITTSNLPEKETLILIYNNQGQLLLSENLNNQNTTTIDISKFPAGVYNAKVQTGHGVAQKKFIVIK